MNQKHEFAFFTTDVAQLKRDNHDYTLRDADLVRRLLAVVRVQPEDTVLLFDDAMQVACTVVACSKKDVIVRVDARSEHTVLQPEIIWLLPILEREAFEESLEALTVMGANQIVPVITQKSRRTWAMGSNSVKDRDRARRLMLAAAEQSKQFLLPKIQETLALKDALATYAQKNSEKVFFDAQGQSAFDVVGQMKKRNQKTIVVLVGPEGDLTTEEKTLAEAYSFVFCKLTPTILRASAAVEVGMGLLRSCL